MKKCILTLISILIVSMFGTITANAVYDIDNISKTKILYQETVFQKKNIDFNKEIELPNGVKENIQYIETKKTGIITMDVYQDSNGVKYNFSEEGDKIGVSNIAYIDTEKGHSKSKEALEQIAIKYAHDFYGNQFKGFELISFKEASYLGEEVMTYTAHFAKRYGENKFVQGETCYLSMTPDGVILYCTMSAYGNLDGFDQSTLNGIKSEDVESYIDKIVKLSYAEDLVDYQISSISLNKIDGIFVLQIPTVVNYTYEGGSEQHSIGEVYYYEIPQ